MEKFSSKEFAPKLGSAGKGALSAVGAFIKFLFVPYLLVTIVDRMTSGEDDAWVGTVNSLATDMLQVVIIFGLVLTVLSFLKGFYPKGSYSRMIFSVVCAVVVLVFGYSLMLGGDVQSFFDSESLDIDVMFLFYLFILLVALRVLQHIGELPDHRFEFMTFMSKKLGTPAPAPVPIEDVNAHKPQHDFRPRYGRLSSGFKEARKAAGTYIAWPVFSLMVAGAAITKIGDEVPVEFTNELEDLVGIILLIGIALCLLMFFKGFYPKGSVSRMSFWIAAVAIICLWIWNLSFEGNVAIEIADVATVNFDYTPIVLLFILAAGLWAVYAAVEMISYRKDWKANNFQPVDDKKIKKRKAQEMKEAKQKAKDEKVRAKQERSDAKQKAKDEKEQKKDAEKKEKK